MSRPLAISQKQVTALCKGAAAAGFVAEVVIGGVVVRLVPDVKKEQGEEIRLA